MEMPWTKEGKKQLMFLRTRQNRLQEGSIASTWRLRPYTEGGYGGICRNQCLLLLKKHTTVLGLRDLFLIVLKTESPRSRINRLESSDDSPPDFSLCSHMVIGAHYFLGFLLQGGHLWPSPSCFNHISTVISPCIITLLITPQLISNIFWGQVQTFMNVELLGSCVKQRPLAISLLI